MFTLTPKHQWLVGGLLLLAMLLTRPHITDHLQDASWAVFFLAGFYLRHWLVFGVFMAVAVAIDYVAITKFGVSDFCVSRAYVAIIPGYAALFAAGRWFAGQYNGETLVSLAKLVGAVLLGFAVAQFITSGSFYFFSGKFMDTNWVEFGGRLVKYAPHGLYVMGLYLSVAAFVHVAINTFQRSTAQSPR